jgi:hypothetical protein
MSPTIIFLVCCSRFTCVYDCKEPPPEFVELSSGVLSYQGTDITITAPTDEHEQYHVHAPQGIDRYDVTLERAKQDARDIATEYQTIEAK